MCLFDQKVRDLIFIGWVHAATNDDMRVLTYLTDPGPDELSLVQMRKLGPTPGARDMTHFSGSRSIKYVFSFMTWPPGPWDIPRKRESQLLNNFSPRSLGGVA